MPVELIEQDPAEWQAVSGTDRRCRRAHCKQTAVARLWRRHYRGRSGLGGSWWYYCEEHCYGRLVRNGKVYWPRVTGTRPFVEGDTVETWERCGEG
jgi:hypothetical protein